MNINIEVILKIKEYCCNEIIRCLNEQIELIRLVKAGEIDRTDFTDKFNSLQDERDFNTTLKEDCNIILEAYSNV